MMELPPLPAPTNQYHLPFFFSLTELISATALQRASCRPLQTPTFVLFISTSGTNVCFSKVSMTHKLHNHSKNVQNITEEKYEKKPLPVCHQHLAFAIYKLFQETCHPRKFNDSTCLEIQNPRNVIFLHQELLTTLLC